MGKDFSVYIKHMEYDAFFSGLNQYKISNLKWQKKDPMLSYTDISYHHWVSPELVLCCFIYMAHSSEATLSSVLTSDSLTSGFTTPE